MARPIKQLNVDQIEQLAAINCSLAEIAAVMDCDPKTLTNRYSSVIEKGREKGKSSLKRKMWETAQGGNITMMIWLSKQMLGYSDKIEQKLDAEHKGDVTIDFTWADQDHTQAPTPNTSAKKDQ